MVSLFIFTSSIRWFIFPSPVSPGWWWDSISTSIDSWLGTPRRGVRISVTIVTNSVNYLYIPINQQDFATFASSFLFLCLICWSILKKTLEIMLFHPYILQNTSSRTIFFISLDVFCGSFSTSLDGCFSVYWFFVLSYIIRKAFKTMNLLLSTELASHVN